MGRRRGSSRRSRNRSRSSSSRTRRWKRSRNVRTCLVQIARTVTCADAYGHDEDENDDYDGNESVVEPEDIQWIKI